MHAFSSSLQFSLHLNLKFNTLNLGSLDLFICSCSSFQCTLIKTVYCFLQFRVSLTSTLQQVPGLSYWSCQRPSF